MLHAPFGERPTIRDRRVAAIVPYADPRRLRASRRSEVFKTRHFRFWLEDERSRALSGVAWKMAERVPPVGVPVDLAIKLNWNFFNDRKLLQLELVDWRLSA